MLDWPAWLNDAYFQRESCSGVSIVFDCLPWDSRDRMVGHFDSILKLKGKMDG